jgi:hypothetical protein
MELQYSEGRKERSAHLIVREALDSLEPNIRPPWLISQFRAAIWMSRQNMTTQRERINSRCFAQLSPTFVIVYVFCSKYEWTYERAPVWVKANSPKWVIDVTSTGAANTAE